MKIPTRPYPKTKDQEDWLSKSTKILCAKKNDASRVTALLEVCSSIKDSNILNFFQADQLATNYPHCRTSAVTKRKKTLMKKVKLYETVITFFFLWSIHHIIFLTDVEVLNWEKILQTVSLNNFLEKNPNYISLNTTLEKNEATVEFRYSPQKIRAKLWPFSQRSQSIT